jgi:hypothetical protein
MSLHPCPSCGRHVRRSESSCPFCSVALAFDGVPERGVPAARLGRAATFAFGAAATASALVGCGAAPAYGGPPHDANVVDASVPVDAFVGGFDAAYGGPPIDAAGDVDAGVDGGLAGAYGGPPVDASNADAGAPMNLYGAPPP